METNEEKHGRIMKSHDSLLLTMSASVERIESALIGTAFTNNKGLVHKVAEIEERVDIIDDWMLERDVLHSDLEKRVKKTHSVWAVVAAVIVAVIAIFDFVFHSTPKK